MTAATPVLTTFVGDHGPEVWATPKPPAGARLVSYSELQSMDCWLKHHYSYGLGLKPTQRYVALQLGSAWDAFYNTWFGGEVELPDLPRYAPELPDIDLDALPESVQDALLMANYPHDAGLDDLLHAGLAAADHELRRDAVRVMGELTDKGLALPFDWDDQLRENRTLIYGMAMHYAARWHAEDEQDGSTTLGVQVRFAVPLPSARGGVSNKFYLHGVIDRLEQRGSDLWIVDAKLRMGTIEDDYRAAFETDPQLDLYGWAMRQAGWPVVGGYIDAAAAKLPRWPELKQPETVYELNSDGTPVLDADGKPVAVQEPVPCPACEGEGTHPLDHSQADGGDPCAKCDGEGVARYASGARKGEVKTRAKKQPALYSGWENATTLPIALAAIKAHDLPDLQYAAHLTQLGHQWAGRIESRFHWRMDREPYTPAQLARASAGARGVAGYLDTLPPVPMSSRMKCKYCSFRSLCPSVEPVDFAEGFTTREQRKAASEARRATEAANADDQPYLPTPTRADDYPLLTPAAAADDLDGVF